MMNNSKKRLPIIISTIVMIVFLVVPFVLCNNGQSVTIKAPSGSYAETYANDNKLSFVALPDSENPDVEIPSATEKETELEEGTTESEKTTEVTTPTEKDNGTFTYNYKDKTITITGCKGISSVVEIPSELDGLPVTAINMNALRDGVRVLQIPSSVVKIEGTYKSARYTPAFYTAVAIIILAYAFALIATSVGMKRPETDEGTFYGISFAYSGVVTLFLIGIWCNVSMFIRLSPVLQVVVSIVFFAFAVARLFMRSTAVASIEATGEKIKNQTFFIKSLTVDAQSIMARATTDEAKADCKKVYEAIRYSDPMSNEALSSTETQITIAFNKFADAVQNNAETSELAENVVILVKDRNEKCKLLK